MRIRHHSHSAQSHTGNSPKRATQPQRFFHRRSSTQLPVIKFLVFDYYELVFQSFAGFPNRMPQGLLKLIFDSHYAGYMIVTNQYLSKIKNKPQSCAGVTLHEIITLDGLNEMDLTQSGAVRMEQLVKLIESLSLQYPDKKISLDYIECSAEIMDTVKEIAVNALSQRVELRILQYSAQGDPQVVKKIGYPQRKHLRESVAMSTDVVSLPGSPDLQSTPTLIADYPTSESSLFKRDSDVSEPKEIVDIPELIEQPKPSSRCVIL